MPFDLYRIKLRVWWNKLWAERNRKLRDRERAVKIEAKLDRYMCDALIVAFEEAIIQGRFSAQVVQQRYETLAKKLGLIELLPKKLRLKRRDIHALKKELKSRKPEKTGNGSYKVLDEKVVTLEGKRKQHSILNRKKAA